MSLLDGLSIPPYDSSRYNRLGLGVGYQHEKSNHGKYKWEPQQSSGSPAQVSCHIHNHA